MSNYSDIDFNFYRHPSTGDISVKRNADAVSQSVRNLILTTRYERPFQETLFCNIRKQLFEPMSPMSAHLIRREIIDVLKDHEPRIVLQDVSVMADPDKNSYNVNIYYRIINQEDGHRTAVQLERLR
jgi:uncharacterized protein